MATTNTRPESPYAVRQRLEKQATDRALEAFSEHRVTVLLDNGLHRQYRCQKPSTWNMGFDVTTTPGHLFVTGDIGDLIASRCDDMLAWASGSVRSWSYFAEKVPHAIPTKEYSPEVAEATVCEMLWMLDSPDHDDCCLASSRMTKDAREELQDILNCYDFSDLSTEHAVKQAIYDSGIVDGCDFPDLYTYNQNFLWCRAAVEWLTKKLAK